MKKIVSKFTAQIKGPKLSKRQLTTAHQFMPEKNYNDETNLSSYRSIKDTVARKLTDRLIVPKNKHQIDNVSFTK